MNTPIPTPRTDANAGCLIDSEEVVPAIVPSATNGEALVSEINRLLVRLDAQGVSANEIVACIKPLIADSEARACDQLRAEVARLSEWQAGVIKNARAHHAQLKDAIARAERAEAELTFQQGRNSRLFEQRDAAVAAQEKAEAELAAERARLDWLQAQEVKRGFECGITADDPSFLVLGEDGTTHWGNTYREAIDAAMKEDK